MNETKKQIDRYKRIEAADKWYLSQKRILENKRAAMVKQDKEQERYLLERCKQAVFRNVEKESCKCCPVRYPGAFVFTEDGLLFYRYDADHPNDIIDFEVNIDDLLTGVE